MIVKDYFKIVWIFQKKHQTFFFKSKMKFYNKKSFLTVHIFLFLMVKTLFENKQKQLKNKKLCILLDFWCSKRLFCIVSLYAFKKWKEKKDLFKKLLMFTHPIDIRYTKYLKNIYTKSIRMRDNEVKEETKKKE